MEKLNIKSGDVADANVAKIAALFPQCVTERIGKSGTPELAIDFDKLRAELSKDVLDAGEERYQFTWPDKRAASRLANEPTDKTLRPDIDSSVDFWNTENLYLEGDNLDVLKVLRENYLGKVKMIYIDPPYNTGNDFVYNDDFAQSREDFETNSGLFDEDGNQTADPMVRNTESNGRFHTDWLNMIYPRLKVARDLLSEDGVIFISIDENEIENLRKVCDEIFGNGNFVAQFIWKKKQGGGNDSSFVVAEHEYILCFAKDTSHLKLNPDKKYKLDDNLYPYSDEKGDYGLITLDKASIQFSQSLVYEIKDPDGNVYMPRIVKGKQSCWRWGKAKVQAQYNDLVFKNGKVYTKYYRPEGVTPRSLLIDAVYGRTESGNDDIKALFEPNPFSYPKPILLVGHFVAIATNSNDIILDFFSGSATTAHAVMKLNAEDGGHRKFIMVQLPEVTDEKSEARKAGYETICQIGEERIRRAGKKVKEEAGLNGQNLDTGFRVLKLDSSNMEDVFYTPEDFNEQTLFNTVDNVKPDRTPLDLLFQVMPELNIELSAKIEGKDVNGKKVFFVDGSYLIATFDTDVNESTVTEIAKMQPQYFVMRDASAANDNVLDNFEQIFRHYSPDTIRKIL
ncbi:MAG: site-specific DNA-methyltransferase [Pseudoflavonifractor sp.]|nr:site-specific DNA-methyltransferase [Pseudoflavonifractor sp.]